VREYLSGLLKIWPCSIWPFPPVLLRELPLLSMRPASCASLPSFPSVPGAFAAGRMAGVQRLAEARGSAGSVRLDLRLFDPLDHNRQWPHNLTVYCSLLQPIAVFGGGSPGSARDTGCRGRVVLALHPLN
jgi:hypothetical protein